VELDLVDFEHALQRREREHEAAAVTPDGNARVADHELEGDVVPQRRVVGERVEGIERERCALVGG
jgi:hypothetical protein